MDHLAGAVRARQQVVEHLVARPLLATLAVAILVVLPSFWTAQASIDDTQRRLADRAREEQGRAALAAADLVQTRMLGIQGNLASVASTRFTLQGIARHDAGLLAGVVREARPLVGVAGDALTLSVLDATGVLLALDPPQPELIGRSFADREYVKAVTGTSKPVASNIYTSALRGNVPAVVVAVPVLAESGTLVGIVASAVDLAAARHWFAPIPDTYEDVYLVDGAGRLILRRAGNGGDALRDLSADPSIASELAGRPVLGAAEAPIGGGRRVVATALVPGVGWHVAVISLPDREAAAVSPVVQNLLVLRLVNMLLLLAATYVLARAARGLFRERHRLAVVADERARAATEAHAAEERLASILRGATEVAIVASDLEGRVEEFNAGAERLLGWSATEVRGRTLLTWNDPDALAGEAAARGVAPGLDAIFAAARRGEADTRERAFVRKDGSHVPVEITVTPRYGLDGRLIGFISIAVDITERKRVAHALQEASRHKSEFVANMSHELRTPLNAVLGFSAVLREQLGASLTDRQRRYLDNIRSAGEHLLELVNDVLDLSRVEAGRLELRTEPIALGVLLEPAVAQIGELAKARGVVFAAPDVPDAEVTVDPARIRQALLNVLSNAVKFTPAGGRVVLDVTVRGHDLRLDVTDTGIGIPDDARSRVFGVFERVHDGRSDAPGTGLGLAITKSLVEMQGGTIDFTSRLDVGSHFWIVLPGVVREPVVGPRVLVVDDEGRDAELIAALAQDAGLAAEIAPTATSALAAIIREPPIGVVLDLRLPDQRGEAILRALKSDPAMTQVPVLVVTVEDDDGLTRRMGADGHMTKPIEAERLRAWLARLQRGTVDDARAPR